MAASKTSKHTLVRRKRPQQLPKMTPETEIYDGQLDDMSFFSQDDSVATARTFVSSLHLSGSQMEGFIEDPGNFIYLSHKEGSSGMAYDLDVVDYADLNEEDYYTLSTTGITHFLGTSSDFTPLAQWEREYLLFNKMRRKKFFAQYRMWKNFKAWLRNSKSGVHGRAAKALTENLFIFIPSLRDALLEIKKRCYEVSMMRLFSYKQGQTYTLQEFIDYQQGNQETLTIDLNHFSEDVHRIVRNACDEIVDQFLNSNKIEADHKMTFMERASLRSECRKLTRFLKLTDFVVIDMLQDLAFDSVEDAVRFVKPEGELPRIIYTEELPEAKEDEINLDEDKAPDYVPLFRIVVESDISGELQLGPSADAFKKGFEQIIGQSLRVVGIPERVFTHEELSAYIMTENGDDEAGARDEVAVFDLVANDEKFEHLTNKIYLALNESFDEVQKYIDVFSPYKETFASNTEYIDGVKDMYRELDLDHYREEILKFKGMRQDFDGIPCAAAIRIFMVDSMDLKMKLMPSPVQCLYALQSLLPELIEEKSASLSGQIGEVLPVISKAPDTVGAFIKRKKVVVDSTASMEDYKAQHEMLKNMNALMVEQSWTLADERKAQLRMIDDNMASMESGIQKAEATDDEDSARFKKEINDEIPGLNKNIAELRSQLEDSRLKDLEQKPSAIVSFLEEKKDMLDSYKQRAEDLQEYQTVLGEEATEYEVLEEVVMELKLNMNLWNGVREWEVITKQWESTALKDVDSDMLEKKVTIFNRTCSQAIKGLANNPVGPSLKQKVDLWSPVLPVVVNLRNQSLKPRHWEEIHSLIGFHIQGDDTFTLLDLIQKKVTDHAEEITNTATTAVQETVLEEMMAKVTGAWKTTEFEVKTYKDQKDLFILGDVSEIIANLDESLVTVNTVLGSRYVGGIREFVEKWRKDLMLFQDTLDEWMMCMRGWMYLETIFSSPDIVRQLPAAAKSFAAVDKGYKLIMKQTNEDPLALKAGTVKDRKELFQKYNNDLDKIQKSLEEYLETKRSKFPRFYFLSNDELLEILSQAKVPSAVQPHLRKCFEALVALKFGDDSEQPPICAMISPEKESVDLPKNLKVRGDVEGWLGAVEIAMKQSLQKVMKLALIDYDGKERSEWVLQHPGQVVATVAQMTWARGVEAAIRAEEASDPAHGLKPWCEDYINELLKLIDLIRQKIPKIVRKVVVALVTTDVHARDINQELEEAGVRSLQNFK